MLPTDYRPAGHVLSEREQKSLLSHLGSHTGKAISDVLWAIDTPRAVVASGIDYYQDGKWNNPLSSERVYGEDILRQAGMSDGTGRFVAGLGLDIATDPLTFLTGGLTKGGKALQKIGLLDDAAEVASRRIQREATDAGLSAADLGGRARRTVEQSGTTIEQFVDHSSRPLSGQRAALRSTTLDEVVQHAAAKDPNVLRDLDAFLSKKGWQYDDIKNDTLGRTFGLAGTAISGDALGRTAGDALAFGMDRLGEAARWSKPGVLAHAYFNKLAGNADDAVSQAAAIRINKAANEGQARGNRIAADLAYDLRQAVVSTDVAARTGISDVFSPQAADAIDRYIEGVAQTANDIDFVENSPGVLEFVKKWQHQAGRILRESEDSGLRAHALNHAYNASYRPYQLETALERSARGGGGKVAQFDLVTGDMLARKKSLQLPGGLDHLRSLSTDPRFVGLGDAFVEDDVAEALFREINNPSSQYYLDRAGTPVGAEAAAQRAAGGTANYSKAKARGLARFLHSLPGDTPVFGNHPAEASARYIAGRERAIATAPELVDTIASMIVDGKAGQAAGGRHVSAGAALQKLGLRSPKDTAGVSGGASNRLREKIAEALSARQGTAVSPDSINLSDFSVPMDRLDAMRRMADLFNTPKAKTQVGQFLDQYVKVFKAQVLTWPSRFTRDFMSGAISNLIEVGPRAAMWTARASQLLDGQYDKFLPALKSLPTYASMTDDAALKAFMQDAAEHRILGGLRLVDYGDADRTGRALQEVLPGVKRVSLRGSFGGTPGRSWGEAGRNAFDFFGARGVSWGNGGVKRAVHNNPVYQAGENLGELTDSLNRMGGYLALLSDGVAPREAAERMRAVHVAYDSLSDYEKSLRDSVLPFYAYTSRIGKYVFDEITKRPGGRYTQSLRALDKTQTSDEDTYVPATMRERTSIPLSEELFGEFAKPGPGLQRFVSNIDFPGMAAVQLGSSVRDEHGNIDLGRSAMSTIQNVGSMAAPHLRTGAELLSGVDLYTKEKLGAVPSEIDQITGALIGDENFQWSPAINMASDLLMPGAGRVLSAGRQVADPRIEDVGARIGQMLFNQVAPVKVNVVDEKRQRRDAVNQIDDLLSRSPHAYTISNTVVSKEDFEKLSPEMQQLVLLKQALEKQGREERAAKDRAAKLSLR